MNLKRGTPAFGIALGIALVAIGVLIMLIGFWKTLLLAALFAVGFFLGTVENKSEFMKNAANKLIPDKEAKVIDLKSELARDQEAAAENMDDAAKTAGTVNPVHTVYTYNTADAGQAAPAETQETESKE